MGDARRDKQWAGQRRPWLWIGLCAAAWAALSTGVWMAVRAAGARRLETELAALRSAGQPCWPSDFGVATKPVGVRTVEAWLSQLDEAALREPEVPAAAAAFAYGAPSLSMVVRAGMAPPAPRPVPAPGPIAREVQADPACATVVEQLGGDPELLSEWLESILDDPLALRGGSSCAVLALDTRASSSGVLELAEAACTLRPADTAAWFEEMERVDEPLVPRFAHPASFAVAALAERALARALSGEQDAAISALDSALCACDSIAELHWEQAYEQWRQCELRLLEAIGRCLSFVDPGRGLGKVEAHLAGLDARSRYLASLDGDRALSLRVYERHRAGKTTGILALDRDGLRAPPVLTSPLLLHETADLLADFRTYREWSARPPHAAGPLPRPQENSLFSGAVLSPWLESRWSGEGHPWGDVEARAALVRLAITARRDGAAAASAAAATFVDPFSGSPLRTRVEGNGTLVIWSVGADGRDDGGAPRSAGAMTSADVWMRVIPR